MSRIIAYSDGAYSGKAKDGGFGIFITETDSRVPTVDAEVLTIIGGKTTCDTTGNRMEMASLIASILLVKDYLESNEIETKEVDIYSDSEYSVKAFNEWHHNWKKNGWKASSGKPVKNLELVKFGLKMIEDAKTKFKLRIIHTPGHAGLPGNEVVDDLAITYRLKKIKNDDQMYEEMVSIANRYGFKVKYDHLLEIGYSTIHNESFLDSSNIEELFENSFLTF
ncbi:ribonuclease H [Proteus mirabilis]|uniref:ribonuclease H n=1 Tax=Proteus mirabilis TaxID=584 RepID=UPI0034D3BA15